MEPCPQCGTPIEPGARFCGECGTAIAGPATDTAASPPPADPYGAPSPPPVPPPPVPPPPVPPPTAAPPVPPTGSYPTAPGYAPPGPPPPYGAPGPPGYGAAPPGAYVPGGPPPGGPGARPSGSGGGGKVAAIAIAAVVVLLLLGGLVFALTRSGDDVAVEPPATTAPSTTVAKTTETTEKRSEIDPDRTTTTRRPTTTTTPPTTQPPVTWATWTAPDGRFLIDFPGTPTVEPVAVDSPALQSASQANVDQGDAGYFVAWYDLAPGYYVSDPNAVLSAGVDGFASALPLTFTRHDLGDFAGNPALFFGGTGSGNIELEGVAIISGARMYLFAAGSSPGTPREFDRFLGSFHIL